MFKKYIYTLSVIFALLLTPIYTYSQIYIEGYGGVNTFTLSKAYNFTGNIGFGYNNKKVKIGVEAGLGTGIGYKYSEDPSGGTGGISFTDYVEGGTYNSPKRSISNSGNIYPTLKDKVIFANQFSFGLNAEWFIINSFTDKVRWFDVGLFSGIGFSHHHSSDTSLYQPYVKAGLELDFIVKDVTFLINGDIRYFVALNGIDNQTNVYHSYLQQTVNIGVRYIIPIVTTTPNKCDNVGMNNLTSINIYNTVKQDTVVINRVVPLPTTILFANDRYDIRKVEIKKLDTAVRYLKEYDLNVEIVGMASKKGGHNHNQKLSMMRCRSVCDYLTDSGIELDRIKINALGDTNSEITEEALDRCVILIFK